MEREREDPKGRVIPKAFLNRPSLAPQNEFYWQAFADLDTERQLSMAAGPIPVSAMMAWADRYGLHDIDEFESFKWIIRSMDAVSREAVDAITLDDVEGVKTIVRDLAKKDSPDG